MTHSGITSHAYLKRHPDWKSATLLDVLEFRAQHYGGDDLYDFMEDGEKISHSLNAYQLKEQALCIADRLRSLLEPRQRVLLLFNNGLDFIVNFFGCLYADLIPVSGVYPDAIDSKKRFSTIVRDAKPSAILGLRNTLSDFYTEKKQIDKNVIWISSEFENKKSIYFNIINKNQEDIAFIQYTSGTTNVPKGVILTHRNIAHNIWNQSQAFSYQENDIGLSWLPLSHDMGLIGGALMSLCAGGKFIFMPPQKFIEKPLRWLKAIDSYRATISGGPNFGYQLCLKNINSEEIKNYDLSCWKIAFNGAEKIDRRTIHGFSEKFAEQGFGISSFFPCYGLAEATLMVCGGIREQEIKFRGFSREGLSINIVQEPVDEFDVRFISSCGKIFSEIPVAIMDEVTEEVLPEDQIGEIWVSGESVSAGYFDKKQETQKKFIHDDYQNVWFRTGDIGCIFDNELYVVGRRDERVRIGDIFVDHDDVHKIMVDVSYKYLESNMVFFLLNNESGNIVISIVIETHLDNNINFYEDAQNISLKFKKKFGVKDFCITFVPFGNIIKTPSGKKCIQETKRKLEDGSIRIIKLCNFDFNNYVEDLVFSDRKFIL